MSGQTSSTITRVLKYGMLIPKRPGAMRCARSAPKQNHCQTKVKQLKPLQDEYKHRLNTFHEIKVAHGLSVIMVKPMC